MKLIVVIAILIIVIPSCVSNKKNIHNYYFVEPHDEIEIKLFFHSDSTFILEDRSGCNQFVYKGKYKSEKDAFENYYIFDSVIVQKIFPTSDPKLFFPIKNRDTAFILNNERLFIHGNPFILMFNEKINLERIRNKKLEEFYVNQLGREGFINTFGNGKGIKEARKRLTECHLPDIKFK